MKNAKNALKNKKVNGFITLSTIGKEVETIKLAVQLVIQATELAGPRAFDGKISLTKNHGMDPGPVANEMTNKSTKTMEK